MRATRRPSTSRRGDPSKPLRAAAERLRGKPGRPRKDGHVPGTAAQQRGMDGGHNRGALAVTAIEPRLVSLADAALYLGVSVWTVRDLEAAGILPRIRVPLPNNGELRKLLFDREDLDRLIEGWKER
ncbi:MAG: helix-turn-helix domain-containing protein [candidate division NC10 bacterium]